MAEEGQLGDKYGQLYDLRTLRSIFPEAVLTQLADLCAAFKGRNNLSLGGAMINGRLCLLPVSVSREILSDPFSRRDLDDG